MTSRDSRLALWLANVRVGLLEHRAAWPLGVWLAGELGPGLMRMTLYVLLGRLAAGRPGMEYAFAGCVVLAVQMDCVSAVSDIPVGDVDARCFGQVRRGVLPPLVQYTGRAVAMMISAAVTAFAAWAVLGLVVGDPHLMLRVGRLLPMLLVAIPCGVVFGLAAIAPAIGNDYQNLVHNIAAAVVTVTSGAVFPTTVSPTLDLVSRVMPLHHTVLAMRAALVGRPWAGELGWEALVGLGWLVVGAVVYAAFDRRGLRTGRGAFAA